MFFNNKFNTFFGLNLTLVYTFPMCMTWRFHFPLRNYDFKLFRILKLSDVLILQTMKVYHKFRNKELPVYMQNWPLIINNEIHQYNTRIASDLHTFRYHHTFAKKSLRHYLVQTINNTPDNVFSKFGTHSLNGFSNYVKLNLINNYQDECNIQNCYICSQI